MRQDLRRLILDQTRDLLISEGYQSLSMRKIAKAIGYSATSIYLHFKNRDALFYALIDEGMEKLYARFEQVKAAVGEPKARLAALCESYVAFGRENPEYYEIMFMAHTEDMKRYPVESYRNARRNLLVFADTFAEGQQTGVFALEDPKEASNVLWAMLHGLTSLLLSHRVDVNLDTDQLIATTIHHALRSFAAVPAPTVS